MGQVRSHRAVSLLTHPFTLASAEPLLQNSNGPLNPFVWDSGRLLQPHPAPNWSGFLVFFYEALHVLHVCGAGVHVLVMHGCNPVGALFPGPLLLQCLVLLVPEKFPVHDCLVLLSLGKVLKCLFVPLPLLPCDVNKFVLIRNHIPLVLFFYLVQHLVLVKPVEAPCLLSSFLSVEQTIHDD